MVIFYNKWKKHNEIQLTKNQMDLNIRKKTNHRPSHGNIQSTSVAESLIQINPRRIKIFELEQQEIIIIKNGRLPSRCSSDPHNLKSN